jgi:hypothetical protein
MDALKKRLMQATFSAGNLDAVVNNDDDDNDKDLIKKEKCKELESLAQLGRERAKR